MELSRVKQQLPITAVRYVGDRNTPCEPCLFRVTMGGRLHLWLRIEPEYLPGLGTLLDVEWEVMSGKPLAVTVWWPLGNSTYPRRWQLGYFALYLPRTRRTARAVPA